MVRQDFTLDMNKPLVFQVGHLGEAYEEWVHKPIVGKERPRLFENDILEFLTLTVWWAVPVIWLPVVCWSVSRGNTIHYLLHGCHHKHPMDGLRLVFPPAGAAIIAALLWYMIKLTTPSAIAPALFGGGLLGYVMYDCTHYYVHHGKPDKGVPSSLKVGHLGEAYQEWVHQPIASKEGPRFFESDFWEFLTKNQWWVIPLIWLPVVCWSISLSVRMGHTPLHIALMMVFGILIWTLIEYTLHRFLFHINTKSYWGNTIHYLLHGCHHKHPMDGLRLVFPPAATAVLCVPFWNLVKLIFTPSLTPAMFGGGLLGYVMYDVTHYYLHHGQPTSEIPRNLKSYEKDVEPSYTKGRPEIDGTLSNIVSTYDSASDDETIDICESCWKNECEGGCAPIVVDRGLLVSFSILLSTQENGGFS
ncbi:hypothetical protein RHGRI_036861 [Rhododendron griersonianum]|uniref:Fatty acid hydroxylase domain-containing protein n=1 Tax=Rhododendron griersonianum TaxID=479676 RepID=A0AAV6HTE9_9ERIC|nr:hypothetical protein RHGRI_036861 [Rhododendron griersonianum]